MNDFRFAFRQLFKSPAFTIVAIVTLGLGIAASTAIFSVVDAVLLHPLPYPDSERIVTVSQTVRSTGISTQDASPANFIDWAAQNSVFSAMACTRGWQANLSGGEEPERIRATMVSGQFFTLFESVPPLGRRFRPGGRETGKCTCGRSGSRALDPPLWRRSQRHRARPDPRRREIHRYRRHAAGLFTGRLWRTLGPIADRCPHTPAFA